MAASGRGTGGTRSAPARPGRPRTKSTVAKKTVAKKTGGKKTVAKKIVAKKTVAKKTQANKPRKSSKAAVRPEEFRERLGSLENLLEEALRDSGGTSEVAEDEGPLARAAEGALDLYARLGRTLEEASVSDALAQIGSKARGSPDDFGYDPEFERALMPLLRFLYRSWWRVQTVGIERIPSEGPVVLVANHSGSLFAYDGAMLRTAVREAHPAARAVRPLLDGAVCDTPVLGEILARCGGVRASGAHAAALLSRDGVVACFPEGDAVLGKPYSRRYELASFGDHGFVRWALQAGAPIVPVAIVGAEETHPVLGRLDWVARRIGMPYLPLTPTFPWLGLGGLLPLPSRWRIDFGAPISGLDRLGPGDGEEGVQRISERVRDRVQSLVDKALRHRGRAFF